MKSGLEKDLISHLQQELEEQCRLNGMGAEREAKLLSKVEALEELVKKKDAVFKDMVECSTDKAAREYAAEALALKVE